MLTGKLDLWCSPPLPIPVDGKGVEDPGAMPVTRVNLEAIVCDAEHAPPRCLEGATALIGEELATATGSLTATIGGFRWSGTRCAVATHEVNLIVTAAAASVTIRSSAVHWGIPRPRVSGDRRNMSAARGTPSLTHNDRMTSAASIGPRTGAPDVVSRRHTASSSQWPEAPRARTTPSTISSAMSCTLRFERCDARHNTSNA